MKKQTKQLWIPCAAAVLTIGTSMMSWAAVGWQEVDGTWRYCNANGEYATDTWKKSGDHWFWLDEDGEMVTDSLIEDDEDYYYVNESGAMVKNEWRGRTERLIRRLVPERPLLKRSTARNMPLMRKGGCCMDGSMKSPAG